MNITNKLSKTTINQIQNHLLKDIYRGITLKVVHVYTQLKNQSQHFHYDHAYFAGHSKWANIKFKKMHKDNARAKVFGKLSLEIIQAVKENGPDPTHNAKLEALVLKAKSCCMPKDKIETSIKNALRNTEEQRSNVLLQVRGPGKCGLLIDLLTPNPARSKPEIRTILKKHEATYIEDGSVAFMFDHKGVLAVENDLTNTSVEIIKEKAEEIAILIGAEDVRLHQDEGENSLQFFCAPLDVLKIKKTFEEEFPHMRVLSADIQYLAKTLVKLSEKLLTQADELIDVINDHPDVLQIYDNIYGYHSKTIKLTNDCGEFT